MTGLALAWEQFRLERKLFWRNPSAAFFSFVLPLMLLLLVASVFGSDQEDLDIVIPGVAGMSVMATTFNSLAFNLTFLREQGILKRVRGTPLPASSYFAGFLGNAVANAFVQVILVVAIGHLAYDVSWPQDWLALVVFTAVGVVTFGALGIALSHAIPNFDSRSRVRERHLPAGHPDLRRLLLGRLAAARAGRGGRRAAAQARDRRPPRRDRHRAGPGRQRRRAGDRGAVGRGGAVPGCARLPLGVGGGAGQVASRDDPAG